MEVKINLNVESAIDRSIGFTQDEYSTDDHLVEPFVGSTINQSTCLGQQIPSEEKLDLPLTTEFEFISPQAVLIKGTRVGIEIVIEKFLDDASPKEIQQHHPHLTLKQIYAAITYYLFNKDAIDAYVEAGRKRVEAAYEAQRKNPSPGVKRLMEIRAQRETQGMQFCEE